MRTVAPFLVNARLDDSIGEMVGSGEHYDVPIGALAGFQIVVTVNHQLVPVIESTWWVQGQQVVPNTVAQTAKKGTALLERDRLISGDPSSIETAWTEPGTFGVVISGKYQYKKSLKPFQVSGSVTVHAPQFHLSTSKPDVSQPTFDENKLTTQFATTPVGYSCDGFTVGGRIGFLQVIHGLRLRGPEFGVPTQSMGGLQNFLDWSNEELFYQDTAAQLTGVIQTTDQPSLACVDQPEYNWYRIGEKGEKEHFSMFLAYKAPVTAGIIESYIVVYAVCRWAWSMVGLYEGDAWGPDPDYTSEDCSGWEVKGWSMPLWTDNSEGVGTWTPYHAP
jgi:hypothetical protein